MDWFASQLKTSLAEAQKKAQEASVQARALAQQASVQARALAEQASVQAKALAERAAEEAAAVHTKLNTMAGPAAPAAGPSASPEELARFGVCERLLELVGGLTYSQFSDMKAEAEHRSSAGGAPAAPTAPGAETRLTAWQERHALLVLGQSPHLQGLRFALSPRHMSDSQFWCFYFQLVDIALPPERERDAALHMVLEGTADASAQVGTTARSSATAAGSGPSAGTGLTGKAATETASAVFGSLFSKTQSLLGSAYQQATGAGPASANVAASGVSSGAADDTAPAGAAQQAGGLAVRTSTAAPGPSGTVVASGSLLAPKDAAAADRQGEALQSPTCSAGTTGLHATASGAVREASAPGEQDEEDSGHVHEEAGAAGSSSEPLGDLEDDPELAAYLQEALAVDDEGGEGGGAGGDDDEELSGLGSAAEDLDDYINQLDAELAAGAQSEESSPAKALA